MKWIMRASLKTIRAASARAMVGVLLLHGFNLPAAGTATLTVQAGQAGVQINRAMWGVFFEDINFGADGGLYAELVKNRGFEFPDPMMGWIKIYSNNGRTARLSIHDEQSVQRRQSALSPAGVRRRKLRSAWPMKVFAAWA